LEAFCDDVYASHCGHYWAEDCAVKMSAANNLDEHLQVVKNPASNVSCPFKIEFHNDFIYQWTSTAME
jgi:hypothetical protein